LLLEPLAHVVLCLHAVDRLSHLDLRSQLVLADDHFPDAVLQKLDILYLFSVDAELAAPLNQGSKFAVSLVVAIVGVNEVGLHDIEVSAVLLDQLQVQGGGVQALHLQDNLIEVSEV